MHHILSVSLLLPVSQSGPVNNLSQSHFAVSILYDPWPEQSLVHRWVILSLSRTLQSVPLNPL